MEKMYAMYIFGNSYGSLKKGLSEAIFFQQILFCKEPIFSMHALLPLFGVIRCFFVIEI